MHAAVTSSDAIVQWLEQRESVVNQIQNDYNFSQNQLVDQRSVTFDQSVYNKLKFSQQNYAEVTNFDQTNVDMSTTDNQSTFQQLNVGAPPAIGYDDPPDRSIGGNAAPELSLAQHHDMVQTRNDLLTQPNANERPIHFNQAQPIQENPPADAENFTSIKKHSEFIQQDETKEQERDIRAGEKRSRSDADLAQVSSAKLRGVDPGMVYDEVDFDSAQRPDKNVASGLPENRLIALNPAFNQMGTVSEDPEDITEAGRKYLDKVEEALNKFKTVRIRNSEDEGKVGLAAWRVVKTAPHWFSGGWSQEK